MMPMPDQPPFDPDFASPADWAWEYRRHGIQVVPVYKPEERPGNWKHPRVPWKDLEYGSDVEDLRWHQWYDRQKGQFRDLGQIGIVCGKASDGIFILDLDDYKDEMPRIWWQTLLHTHNSGDEPETWQQVTGGGGRHLLWRAPPHWTPPTGKTTMGVDVRGQGGFAVLAPSRHDSGKDYKWVAGCAPWECDIATAPQWLTDAIDTLIGPAALYTSGGERTASPAAAFDAWGKLIDGREDKMSRLVWGRVVHPGSDNEHLWREAYEVYERGVESRLEGDNKTILLEREGRGPSLFYAKWTRAMAQWDGKVAEHAKQEAPKKPEPPAPADKLTEAVAAVTNGQSSQIFEFLDVPAIKNQPDPQWLIKGLVPEKSLGFIYGPPGSGKSFIALGQSLSIACELEEWWGRKIERYGAVVYISSEGQADMKFRIAAWEQQNQLLADPAPFYLIRQSINFMRSEDVAKLVATVQAVKDKAKADVVHVTVDTVSRTLPGADENLQKDMTLFIAACDAVREKFNATVVGVHHTSRAGNLRGSTVFDGAGDFLAHIEREEGAKGGTLTARKIKAAEDGWVDNFALEKIELAMGHSSLVAVKTEAPVEVPQGDGWPDKPTCQLILSAIREAWESGQPWSSFPQARKHGRYAARLISTDFNVPAKVAENMVETWLMRDVLAVQVRDAHHNLRGLKVIGSIY
jgi:hypothetical protein